LNKDDCIDCNNYNSCNKPCLYLAIIRSLTGCKNKPLMERLAPPDISDDKTHRTDYKTTLIDRQQARQNLKIATITDVRNIQDINQRAVASMLYANISLRDIAFLLDKSERTIRRLCQQ